jgi:hypothetical protein
MSPFRRARVDGRSDSIDAVAWPPLALACGLMVALALADAPAAAAPQGSGQLRVGETFPVAGTRASVTFEAVQSDSRCPKNARCIRAGEAVVLLVFRTGDGEEKIPLTFRVPPEGGATQSTHGYEIQILRLDPQTETEVEIAPGDYVASVRVQTR